MWLISRLKSILQFRNRAQPDDGYITMVYRHDGEAVVVHDSLSGSDSVTGGETFLWEEWPSADIFGAYEGPLGSAECDSIDEMMNYPVCSLLDDEFFLFSSSGATMGEDFSSARVNPCSGLPMLDDAVDIAGNLYGMCSDIGDFWNSLGDNDF